MPGYYENFSAKALPCSVGCSSCNSSKFCITCFSGFFLLTDGFCNQKCPISFFPENFTLTCKPCLYECLTCNRVSFCQSCSLEIDFRQLDNVTMRCVPLVGYFDNNDKISLKCPVSCVRCLSATFCTSCNTGFYLYNNTCNRGCPSRYFAEENSLTCRFCPYDCLHCNKNGDCTDCSLTNDYRMVSGLSNRCLPLIGYYDNLTQVGKLCRVGCLACFSQDICSGCIFGYYLNSEYYCLTSCPLRRFADNLTQTCQPCPYDCSTCDQNGNCLSCS